MERILNNFIAGFKRKFNLLLFDKQLPMGIKTPIKHILVINWNGKIGDAIVSSFFYREIKKVSGITISVVTTVQLKSLYSDHYSVDNVFVVSNNPGYLELFRISRKLQDVDTIIPLMGILNMKSLFFISKLNPTNLFSLDESLGLSNIQMPQNMYIHDIYSFILKQLGAENIDDSYIVPVSYTNNKNFEIAFNPFGSRVDKSLSIDKSVRILNLIIDEFQDLNVGILSSNETFKTAQKIARKVDNKNIQVIKNISSFYDAINIISCSVILISVDTSLVHVAVGLNKKLIAIYYKPKNLFNPWLPKKSKNTQLILSEGVEKYTEKDMNNFNNYEVIIKINEFYK